MELVLQDRDQQVNTDGDPDLGLHGVGRGAEEALDVEVLFDPLEEQLNSPSTFVEVCDRQGGESEVVCEEHVSNALFLVEEGDPSERGRIAVSSLGTSQRDRLV